MPLNIKPKEATQLDLVALGETMIRLSPPGHGRIEFANTLEVWVGGGEYNVAYALSRLGLRTGWTNRLVDNPLGQLVLNHARAVGVDVSHVAVAKYDGVGTADLHRFEFPYGSGHGRTGQRDHVRPGALGGESHEAGGCGF